MIAPCKMETLTLCVFLVICLQTILFSSIAAHRPQEIQFFSDTNFTKKLESFFTTETNLQSLSPVWKKAKSHCVIRGLWRISGTFNYNPNLTFVEVANGIDKNGRVCGSWNSRNQTAQYKSIRLIGSQDLDTPGISFNIKPRFDEEELYFDGKFLRLPHPIVFRSYGFTGKSNWTIYANTDYSGAAECLVAHVDKVKGFAVTFNTNKTLTVGSIWRGCEPLSRAITGSTKPPNPTVKNKSGASHVNCNSIVFIGIIFARILCMAMANKSYTYI